MFYDNKLMNSKTLGTVWKVANNIQNSNGDISLPKICKRLDEWLGSEEESPFRRLSLTTSAIFINGATKIYKLGVQKLFDDIDCLDKEMSSRKRRRSNAPESSLSSTSNSDSVRTPEKMMRRHSRDVGIDTSQIIETRSERKSSEERPPSICNKTGERRTCRGTNNNIFIRDDNGNSSLVTFEDSDEDHREVETKEQEVQTILSFAPNTENEDAQTSNGFDENLPFGYVIVHDNYRSRIPSKIIFSSINANILNL